MKTYTKEELKEILHLHKLWLENETKSDWKLSALCNNEYLVSSCGKAASIFNPCLSLRKTPLILKQNKLKNGYLTIRYKRKHILLHRMVANEFIGPVENKVVHHKDSVRSNNLLENLEITDSSTNNKHGFAVRNFNYKTIKEHIEFYRLGL